VSIGGARPLSFDQERLWLRNHVFPAWRNENPAVLRLTGDVNATALRAAWAGTVSRHESLRTRFPIIEGMPVRLVMPASGSDLALVDLSGLHPSRQQAELSRVIAAEAARPFDLAAGPIARAELVRLAPNDYVLAAGIHHIAVDPASVVLLAEDLFALTAAATAGTPAALPRLAAQYSDYVMWRRHRLTPRWLEAGRAYWKRRLCRVRALDLPTDHPRPPFLRIDMRAHTATLPAELSELIRRFAVANGITPFVVLLMSFTALLSRWTGQDDLTVVTVRSGRSRQVFDRVVGLFTGDVVVRCETSGDPTVHELLGRIREAVLDTLDHPDPPFDELAAAVDPGRELCPHPLRQIGFVLHDLPHHAARLNRIDVAAMPISAGDSHRTSSYADIWLDVFDGGAGPILLRLAMADGLFESATVDLTLRRLHTVIQAAMIDPRHRLSDLPLLSAAELRLLAEWGRGAGSAVSEAQPLPSSVSAAFAEVMAQSPDQIALICGERHISYRLLDRQVRAVAGILGQMGVGADVVVHVRGQPDIALVVAVLAVLRVGGTVVIATQEDVVQRDGVMATTVSLDGQARPARSDAAPVAQLTVTLAADQRPGLFPNAVAWLPTPGEVGLTHGLLHATILAVAHRLGAAAIRFVLVTRPGESLDVVAMLVPLSVGGTLVLDADPAETQHRMPTAVWLSQQACLDAVADGWLPPSGLSVLLDAQVPVAMAAALLDRGVRVWVRAGRHDALSWMSMAPVNRPADLERGRLPLGRALGVPQVQVVDSQGVRAPVGVEGELQLVGDLLPRGLVGDPAGTAALFVPDRDSTGARVWRTGRRVWFGWDGTLWPAVAARRFSEFGGVGIDLTEVEHALLGRAGVTDVVVVRRNCPTLGLAVVPRLVGYVTYCGSAGTIAAELVKAAATLTPPQAGPLVVVMVDAIPRNPDGTPNLIQLPLPTPESRSPDDSAPLTPTECAVAALFGSLLGIAEVGRYDSFFRLGGTSMQVCRLAFQISSGLGVTLPLFELISRPSVVEVAAAIDAAASAQGQPG
jgi:non-ribosomal peptide synthetase component F